VIAAVAMALAGCTSLKPVDMPADSLRADIRKGNLVHPGDRIEVTTNEGDRIRLTVVELKDDQIVGKQAALPVDEVAALKTREVDGGRTAVLASSTTAVAILIILALSSLTFMP